MKNLLLYYYIIILELILLLELFFVSVLNFSGLKSSKLVIFEGVVHNVLSILILLVHSFYIFFELNFRFITFFKELGCRSPYITFYV